MIKKIKVILILLFFYLMVSFVAARYLFEKYFTRGEQRKNEKEEFYEVLKRGPYANMVEKMKKSQRWLEKIEHEDIYIKSYDGLKLHAVMYENKNGNGITVLLSHGYRSEAVFDFCLGTKLYYELGYSILMIDHRAHGKSEGQYITFGVKEKLDIVEWTRYLLNRFGSDHRYIFSGMSMGSTAVILAACDEVVSKNLVCVMVDCGFSTVYDEVLHVMKCLHIPKFPIILFAGRIFKKKTGVSLKDFDTAEELKKSKVPFLFLHGESDAFVPCENTRKNYKACMSEKRIITVPGAGHGMSYLADECKCRSAIIDFLSEVE